MANNYTNPITKLNNFFRINFIGKPFELNKLVNDNSAILETKNEADLVIIACRNYKGWQYLGQILSFSLLFLSSYYSKKFNLSRSKQIKMVVMSFIPGASFYFYSHFNYWSGIRDLVKLVREREKKYAHLNKDEIEDYKIIYNTSKDLHKYIASNLGIYSSIIQVFKKN